MNFKRSLAPHCTILLPVFLEISFRWSDLCFTDCPKFCVGPAHEICHVCHWKSCSVASTHRKVWVSRVKECWKNIHDPTPSQFDSGLTSVLAAMSALVQKTTTALYHSIVCTNGHNMQTLMSPPLRNFGGHLTCPSSLSPGNWRPWSYWVELHLAFLCDCVDYYMLVLQVWSTSQCKCCISLNDRVLSVPRVAFLFVVVIPAQTTYIVGL